MPAKFPATVEGGQGSGSPGVLAALGMLFRGVVEVLRAPRRWPNAYAPVAIALVLLAVIAVAGSGLLLQGVAALFDVPRPAISPALHPVIAAIYVVLVAGTWLLLSVLALSSLASAVGGPFWEKLSDAIEEDGRERPGFAVGRFVREFVESIVLLVAWLASAAAVLLFGLIPVVGTVAAPAMELAAGGFFLAVELTRPALTRRGMRLRERLGFVWRHRWPVLAFGAGAFALFLVPPMSLVAMPGAVVGATRLVRRLEGSRN